MKTFEKEFCNHAYDKDTKSGIIQSDSTVTFECYKVKQFKDTYNISLYFLGGFIKYDIDKDNDIICCEIQQGFDDPTKFEMDLTDFNNVVDEIKKLIDDDYKYNK